MNTSWGWPKKAETCRRITTFLYVVVRNYSAAVGIYTVTCHTARKNGNRFGRGLFCMAVWEALYAQFLIVKIVARGAFGCQLCAERRGWLNSSPYRISVRTCFRNLQCISSFVGSPFCRKSVTVTPSMIQKTVFMTCGATWNSLGFRDERWCVIVCLHVWFQNGSNAIMTGGLLRRARNALRRLMARMREVYRRLAQQQNQTFQWFESVV
jgi:hypothetical protein